MLEALIPRIQVPVSIDTYKIDVAKRALDAGVSIVNNIRGTKSSRAFLKMVRDYGASIVIMHMRGVPATMQTHTYYKNLIGEIIKELKISIEKCLEIGIKKDRIIVDPGIGFAKTFEQNFALINHLDRSSYVYIVLFYWGLHVNHLSAICYTKMFTAVWWGRPPRSQRVFYAGHILSASMM